MPDLIQEALTFYHFQNNNRRMFEAAINGQVEQSRIQASVLFGQQDVLLGQQPVGHGLGHVLGQQHQALQPRRVLSPFPHRNAMRRSFFRPCAPRPPRVIQPRLEESKGGEKSDDEVEIVDAPDEKVEVLEIDEDGSFHETKHIMTPAKKAGDLAAFTPDTGSKVKSESSSSPVDQDPKENDVPLLDEKVSLKARIQALERKNHRLEQENNCLQKEIFVSSFKGRRMARWRR